MELTERVHKLEVGHHDHEIRITKVERENEEQQRQGQNFHDFIVATEARAQGRDKTLKTMLTVLTVISILSPIATILVNAMIK